MIVTIHGAPRTLKNRPEIVLLKSHGKGQPCPHCKRPILPQPHPSPAWRSWLREAEITVDGARLVKGDAGVMLLIDDDGAKVWKPLDQPMNCRALFFRDAKRGDRFGYEQGLGDLLQERGVVVDDVLLETGDGTRLLIDRARPRVEVELTPIAEEVAE